MNKPFQHHQPYKGCDLYLGDALEVLPVLAGEGLKADMVFTDPPYGTTHCRWDSMIDIPDMWQAVSLITMPDTPILLFCQQPFTSVLGSSNLKNCAMLGSGKNASYRLSQCQTNADESARGYSGVL